MSNILFKDDYARAGYDSLHPIVKEIVKTIGAWSMAYDKKPITITESLSTPERDKSLNRVSPAHSQGRAVDIRTSDMSRQKLVMLMQTFTERFKHLGYLTQKGERRLMYYHNSGHGPHIHLACGLDVIEKYKKSYPDWKFPEHKKPSKGKSNAKSV